MAGSDSHCRLPPLEMKYRRMEIQPYQTVLGEIHLSYLEEKEPDKLAHLFQENKLKDYLNNIVDMADDRIEDLMKQGLREDEAQEIVNAQLLCPQNLATPRPLSRELIKKIRNDLQM